jgi:hypothetical protein
MRTLTRTWLMAAAATTMVACGDDGGTGPDPETLVGSWRATKAELVSVANPATKVDLVAQGATVLLVLTEAKAFTLTLTVPGQPAEVTTGTWTSSQDLLSLNYSGGNWQFDLVLSGNTLTLSGANGEWDFNDDGIDDPVKVNLILARVP